MRDDDESDQEKINDILHDQLKQQQVVSLLLLLLL